MLYTRVAQFVITALQATLWLVPAAHATTFSLQLDSANLTKEEERAAADFIRTLESKLPPKMKSVIGRPIQVRFSRLDSTRNLEVTCGTVEKEGFVAGKVTQSDPDTILLHSGLLRELSAGPDGSRKFACGHKNFYRLAQATLAHELLHVYDSTKHPGSRPLSAREQYQRIAGWRPRLLIGATQKNQQPARLAHPYELTSPQEHSAVNFESFLLDPEYRCRRPAFQRIFSKEFDFEPFSAASCEPNLAVMHSSSAKTTKIDPKRVYQVHYLMAEPGDDSSSGWGHSMLRFVICAPERQTVGPDCLKDVDHHLVVSYRANVSDFKISTWKGLTGKYPSQPFVFKLKDIIKEYSQTELRGLTSIPLKLTENQKDLLVEDQIEQFWVYSGSYYFLTNNCATETRDSIASVVDDSHPFIRSRALTPGGVLEDLEKAKLTDLSVLKNREKAINQGYIIPSYEELALNQSFESLRAHIPKEYRNVKDFLKAPAAARAKVYRALPALLWTRDDIIADFIILESQASLVLDEKLRKEFFRLLESKEHPSSKNLARLAENYRRLQAKLQPWSAAKSGYGIPQHREIDPCLSEHQATLNSLGEEIQELMKSAYDEPLNQEIAETETSLRQLLRWWYQIQENPAQIRARVKSPILP
ncbi:MAG: hypothetical protein A2428_11455 [Bdellovibrionales bacterium RIFOXYC1_FULL_54_43]|nr:MAG: hypothetical protein A2428_11455 [Bdellovibrionales bacterium RIFOXYC1_FULL_54_43]OFZ79060.1 MAG: hypothetical protein A2603_12915 [Bdellovibrionales bacterium RIFOXYD1_FULL_55_31]